MTGSLGPLGVAFEVHPKQNDVLLVLGVLNPHTGGAPLGRPVVLAALIFSDQFTGLNHLTPLQAERVLRRETTVLDMDYPQDVLQKACQLAVFFDILIVLS